jgi:hypothetical protein
MNEAKNQDFVFDDAGYLTPYVAIPATFDEMRREFVDAFPTSTTRHYLFNAYSQYNERLRALMPDGFRQWVNGSFISQKSNPRDIDLVTFVDHQLYDRQERTFDELRKLRLHRDAPVDGYFVRVFPEEHRLYTHYEIDCVDWLHHFGYTASRPRRSKGFLELML